MKFRTYDDNYSLQRQIPLKMARKKSKRKNKSVLVRTKPTVEQSEVEIVTDLSQLNNNVSSFDTVDEILLESFTKKEADRLSEPDSVSSDVQVVSVPIKKRVELNSRVRRVKYFKYSGSKFERQHDTTCLDRFFDRKPLKNKKKNRVPKVIYLTIDDDDDDITFKMKEVTCDRIIKNETKDLAESEEIKDQAESYEEDSLEDLKDVVDDYFPGENYDLDLGDLEDLVRVEQSQFDEEKDLEIVMKTAYDLLEVIFRLITVIPYFENFYFR